MEKKVCNNAHDIERILTKFLLLPEEKKAIALREADKILNEGGVNSLWFL